MEIRFYAACLAAYNNGQLHGAWIDATSDEDEMKEAVQAMLKASPQPNAEEWVIHDYDDEAKAISHLGETSDLTKIATIMEAFEEIESDYDDHYLPMLIEWVSERAEPAHWSYHLSDSFRGFYDDAEDYAAEVTDTEGVSEYLKGYIDFKEIARDMALNGVDFICEHTGYSLQDYDSMQGRSVVVLQNL